MTKVSLIISQSHLSKTTQHVMQECFASKYSGEGHSVQQQIGRLGTDSSD